MGKNLLKNISCDLLTTRYFVIFTALAIVRSMNQLQNNAYAG